MSECDVIKLIFEYGKDVFEGDDGTLNSLSYINMVIYEKTGFDDLLYLSNGNRVWVNYEKYRDQLYDLEINLIEGSVGLFSFLHRLGVSIEKIKFAIIKDLIDRDLEIICNAINEYLDREQYIDELMNDLRYM